MSCQPIKTKDGTVLLAYVKPGMKLTEKDKEILEEYVEFCKERAKKKQRERNRKAK